MLQRKGKYMLTTRPLSNHHLNYPLLQWGHIHFHTEGQMSPKNRSDTLQDTIHSTWRCRTDLTTHASSLHPSTRATKTTHTSRGWGDLGTELHLVPSTFFFSHQFWDTREWHIEVGQSLHLQPTTVYTKRRLIPTKTQHPTEGRGKHLSQYIQWCTPILTSRPSSHFLNALATPVLLRAAVLFMQKQNKQHTLRQKLTPPWLIQ